MRVLCNFLTLMLITIFLLFGCTPNTIRVPVEVYVPVKCDAPKIIRPTFTEMESTSDKVKRILIYTETLENDLSYCRGDK